MIRKFIAEIIGTAFLVIFGCGSAVAANTLATGNGETLPLAITTLIISLAFGLGLIVMAYSIGNVSGCHINPAVSIGQLIDGRISVKEFVGYVIAQFIGGIGGAALLFAFFGTNKSLGTNGFGANSALGVNAGIAFLVEVVLTFTFVLLVLGVTSKKNYSTIAGVVIGLGLTMVHIIGVPFTGTSVNPARSFGVALFNVEALSQVWVFLIAPVVGAVIAGLVYRALLKKVAD